MVDKQISLDQSWDENVSSSLENKVGKVEAGECISEQEVLNSEKFQRAVELVLKDTEGFDKNHIKGLIGRVVDDKVISQEDLSTLKSFLDVIYGKKNRVLSLLEVVESWGNDIDNQSKLIHKSVENLEEKIKSYENIISGKIFDTLIEIETKGNEYIVSIFSGKYLLSKQDKISKEIIDILELDDFKELNEQEHIWFVKKDGKWGVFDVYRNNFLLDIKYDNLELQYSKEQLGNSYIYLIGWGIREVKGNMRKFVLYQNEDGTIEEINDVDGEFFTTDSV